MNKRLEEDFKKYLEEEKNKYSSTPSTTNYRERCDVYFYEWSDTKSIPKRFSISSEFFKFLDDCKISIGDSQKKEFDHRYTFHAACFKKSNIICLASSKFLLDEKLSEVERSGVIPTSEYLRNNFTNYNSSYPYHGGCGCYHGHDIYDDCWD